MAFTVNRLTPRKVPLVFAHTNREPHQELPLKINPISSANNNAL